MANNLESKIWSIKGKSWKRIGAPRIGKANKTNGRIKLANANRKKDVTNTVLLSQKQNCSSSKAVRYSFI